ncbi:hypothetical protein F2Q69_00010442 [Brassica cretica]|uniref:Uncharacterized protein n=1 Tax=Brassica cretica TaxID=69181 RepID=A0A8S9R812_BRACR|nr:hypothetical protein F2Q69_00010442 [Brassica cretica]
MASDACAATPRAPHVFQHGQDTCRMPPLLPDVRLHDLNSCKATHHLTHVDQHALVACARHLVLGRSTSCFYMSGGMYCFHAWRHLELL